MTRFAILAFSSILAAFDAAAFAPGSSGAQAPAGGIKPDSLVNPRSN